LPAVIGKGNTIQRSRKCGNRLTDESQASLEFASRFNEARTISAVNLVFVNRVFGF
jgi:hypothetical protein